MRRKNPVATGRCRRRNPAFARTRVLICEQLEARYLLVANGAITFDSFSLEEGPWNSLIRSVDPDIGSVSAGCLSIQGTCDTRASDLAWSSDGSRALFAEGEALFIMDADGSHLRPVQDAGGNTVYGRTPSWVPGGEAAISYSAVTGSTYDIYYATVNDRDDHVEIGTPVNLTNHPNNDFSPTWNSDGTRMAFDSDRSGAGDIYVLNPSDSESATNLTSDRPECFDARPDWSPDSSRIVFVSSCGNSDIWVMDADGDRLQNLTNDPSNDDSPAWSPDGTKIAFSSSRPAADSSQDPEIYVMTSQGYGLHAVTNNDQYDWNPDWRIRPTADVSLEIKKELDPVAKGDLTQFELKVTNNGPTRATGIVVATDPLSTNVDFDPGVNPENCHLSDVRRVMCEFDDLNAGESGTVYIDLQINLTGLFSLEATSQHNEADGNPDNDFDEVAVTVLDVADVSVYVLEADDPISTQDAMIYTLLVSNDGPAAAFDVDVMDSVPIGSTFVSASLDNCHESNRTVTCHFDVIDSGSTLRFKMVVAPNASGELTNTANISVHGSIDKNLGNNRDTDKTTIEVPTDSDGDGLYDAWEMRGMDVNKDGVIDLDLPAMGSHPFHKDLFVEMDYMSCLAGGCEANATRDNRPPKGSMEDVIAAFAAAPLKNPDNIDGVNFHVFIDERIPEVKTILFSSNGPLEKDDFNDLKHGSNSKTKPGKECGTGPLDGHLGTAAERSSSNCANILAARKDAFRYGIFGNSFSETPRSSGRAENGGNDLFVAIGQYSTKSRKRMTGNQNLTSANRILFSGTFMHEFGHTLNLRHGGGDEVNGKPNYLSVMNYDFQLTNIIPSRPLDYSRQLLPTLNEELLSEPDGIGGPEGQMAVLHRDFFDGENFVNEKLPIPTSGPVDWLHDGTALDLVQIDINGDHEWTRLRGYDDWANVSLEFRAFVKSSDGVDEPDEDELTSDDQESRATTVDFDGDSISNADDNCSAVANSDQADTDGNGIGNACQVGAGNVDVHIESLGESVFTDDGAVVAVSFLITNYGTNSATGMTIAPTILAGVKFITADLPAGAACRDNSGTVTCEGFAAVPGGESITGRLIFQPSATGSYNQELAVRIDGSDSDLTDNSTTFSMLVTRETLGLAWQNASNSLDVNSDGVVSVIDALLIVNELNDPEFIDGGGRLPAPPDAGVTSFLDVDGNGFAVPIDVLMVINFLNQPTDGEAVWTDGSKAKSFADSVDWLLASANVDWRELSIWTALNVRITSLWSLGG